MILAADGIILSGPVYFGDRGSLAQEFADFVRNDEECARHLAGRVYGGVAVGAKRNGGQETTLIYQMIDFTTLGMLAVGNDTETTSQYGGTAVAGDVGTLGDDKQGMLTAIGTGRRVAKVSAQLAGRSDADSVHIAVWVLQDDTNNRFRSQIDRLFADIRSRMPNARFVVHEMTREEVYRCIACDICPTRDGPSEEYRCIITAPDDLFQKHHEELLKADAILLAAYSPVDRHAVRSVYQRVIERTRYLRRDHYVYSNILTAPLVVSEVNSNQNLHVRMLTSFVRHHTVLHRPIIGMEHGGEVLNYPHMVDVGASFVRSAARLAAGRRLLPGDPTPYNPVGYVISSAARAAATRTDRV
jgi:multimeric flavodoxin WrbA